MKRIILKNENERDAFLLAENKEEFELEVTGAGCYVLPLFIDDIIAMSRDQIYLVKNPFLRSGKMTLLRFISKLFKHPIAIISRASRHKMEIKYWNEGGSLIIRFKDASRNI